MAGGGAKFGFGRPLVMAEDGLPDGFRVDGEGSLWCGWGVSEALDGVHLPAS
jgi:gluconolactonase